MSCVVGCRCGLDPTLLWLWRRLEATAPIQPLAWELPYIVCTALKKRYFIEVWLSYNVVSLCCTASDSVIHTHTHVLFQVLFHYDSLQDTEYSSPCYFVVHPFYIKEFAYTNPKLPIHFSPLGNHRSVLYAYKSVFISWISSFMSYFRFYI